MADMKKLDINQLEQVVGGQGDYYVEVIGQCDPGNSGDFDRELYISGEQDRPWVLSDGELQSTWGHIDG